MRLSIAVRLACAAVLFVIPQTLIGQTYVERIGSSFQGTTFGTFVPGDASRLFVARIWDARIEILDLTTRTVHPQPFLTITDLPLPLGTEQGLLGLAFDPDYATNGFFYVNYTGADNSLNVVRYRVLGDPATSNVADATTRHQILHVPKGDQTWHNGGWIDFGPNDGNLYVSLGDPCCAQAQDITHSLHGKVLRVDVRGDDFPADPLHNYAIPPTNPFVGREGHDAIWAYGLRNPWRASFDRITGDLWINDTGELTREEVNFQPGDSAGGENYGWPLREGTAGPSPPSPELIEPVYDYPREGPDPLYIGFVIAPAGFYRGPVDAFYGHYFFGDFNRQNIWKLDPDAVDRRASVTNVNHRLLPDVGFIGQVASFGEDAVGNLYVMDVKFGANNAADVYLVTTASKHVVWNGDMASAGTAGDGMSWGDANNWTRGGVADAGFFSEDSVVFAAGSSQSVVNLGADRTVAAARFEAPYRLQGHTLKVLSGNVVVDEDVTATVDSTLIAETVHHSIRKLGLGTLIVNGSAGQIAVKEGTLGGSGTFDHLTVRDGATVAPGATIGILTVEGSLTMHAGSTLRIELAGADNSNPLDPEYDQVVVGGTFAANGKLEVLLADDGDQIFAPDDGDTFTIVSTVEQVVGHFSQIDLPLLSGGLAWEVDPTDGTSFLIRAASMLRSDFNGNGAVDAADYVLWRSQAGQPGIGLAADGTGPGGAPDRLVNEWDYNFWRINFGRSVPGGGALVGVPEPSALALLCVGGYGWLAWRSKKSSSCLSN